MQNKDTMDDMVMFYTSYPDIMVMMFVVCEYIGWVVRELPSDIKIPW